MRKYGILFFEVHSHFLKFCLTFVHHISNTIEIPKVERPNTHGNVQLGQKGLYTHDPLTHYQSQLKNSCHFVYISFLLLSSGEELL